MTDSKGVKKKRSRWKGKPTKAHLKELAEAAKADGRAGVTTFGYSGHAPEAEGQKAHMEKLKDWPRDPETNRLVPLPETEEKTARILELRAVRRKSYSEIATEVGLTKRRVITILERELKRAGALPVNQAERLRQMELIALDNDEAHLEAIARGEHGSVTPDERTRAIAAKKGIRERRAKLAGLDKQSAMTPLADALKQLQQKRPNLKGKGRPMLESEDDFVEASFDVFEKREEIAVVVETEG